MKKVLLRTLVFTLLAVLITGIVYSFITRRFYQETVSIIAVLALLAAIPVVLGYIIAHASLRFPHPILQGIKFLLFIVNGFLFVAATILTILIGSEEVAAFIGIPFILAGFYTYYETIKLIRQPPNPEAQMLSNSDNDVLDDFFMDSE